MNPLSPTTMYAGGALILLLIITNLLWWGDSKLLHHQLDSRNKEIGELKITNSTLTAANNQCAADVKKANEATQKLAETGAAGQKAATDAIARVGAASAASIASIMAGLSGQKPSGDLLTDCRALDSNINAEILRRRGTK